MNRHRHGILWIPFLFLAALFALLPGRAAADECPNFLEETIVTGQNTRVYRLTFESYAYDPVTNTTKVCYVLTQPVGSPDSLSHVTLGVCEALGAELTEVTYNGNVLGFSPNGPVKVGTDGSTPGFYGVKIDQDSDPGTYCFTFNGCWQLGCTQAVLKKGTDGTPRDIQGLTCEPCGPPPDCLEYTISATKFYDFNANGIQDHANDVPLAGWKFTVTDGVGFNGEGYTDANGLVVLVVPGPGTYTVSEVFPDGTWYATTDTSCVIEVIAGVCAYECDPFGNYCLVPSGGLTPGFWSNRNGERTFGQIGGLGIVNSGCKSNATGPQGNFANYAAFRSWLLGGTATNMAYMLSVHTAAMKLNVAANYVNAGSFDLCSGMTIGALLGAANDSLCAYPYTPSDDPQRAAQEALKNCLDALNNGAGVIPPTPCPFSY